MKKKTTIIISSLLALIVLYFVFRQYRIGSGWYKHSGGDMVLEGDVQVFEANYLNLFSNGVYKDGRKCATLVSYTFRLVDDEIVLESLDGKLKGRYCSK